MKRKGMILGVSATFLIVVFLSNCRFIGHVISGIDRAANDPPAGIFLYEDDLIRIETGRHKVVSMGGNGDNDTYRHFIRELLYRRDGTDMNKVLFELDPDWDDYYIRVQYKADGRRSTPALQAVKDYLDPDGTMSFDTTPQGMIVVTPPPAPPKAPPGK